LVKFDRFILFEEDGSEFRSYAPCRARRLVDPKYPLRYLLNSFSAAELAEIDSVLTLAEDEPPRRWQFALTVSVLSGLLGLAVGLLAAG
jgi:hypothetical protein